jgi:hypothetical protein
MVTWADTGVRGSNAIAAIARAGAAVFQKEKEEFFIIKAGEWGWLRSWIFWKTRLKISVFGRKK